MRQSWDVTLAGPDVLLAFKFDFLVHNSQPTGNHPSLRIEGDKV